MKFKYQIIFLFVLPFILNSCSGCKKNPSQPVEDTAPPVEDTTPPIKDTAPPVELKLSFDNKETTCTTEENLEIRINIVSKDKNNYHDYRVKELQITKGALFHWDTKQKLETGSQLHTTRWDYYSECFDFIPTGETGEASVNITIVDDQDNEATSELKFKITSSLRTYLDMSHFSIFANETAEVKLHILSKDKDADKKEYSIKYMEVSYGELQKEDGAKIEKGNTLKLGKNNLVFKAPKELDKEAIGSSSTQAKSDIKLTIVDSQGYESTSEIQVIITPVIFYAEIANLEWKKNKSKPDFIEFNIKIKDKPTNQFSGCESLERRFGEEAWKLVSWKFNDGTPVTIVNTHDEELEEFPLKNSSWLYFKIGNLKLTTNSILTLVIEGPCGTSQEINIDVTAKRKMLIIDNDIANFLAEIYALNSDITDILLRKFKNFQETKHYLEAEELYKKAEKKIVYFQKKSSKIKSGSLQGVLPESTIENLRKTFNLMQELEHNTEKLARLYSI